MEMGIAGISICAAVLNDSPPALMTAIRSLNSGAGMSASFWTRD
jgi:hypothetical protein